MESSASPNNNVNMKILFIEPFYGGSHKALIQTLQNHFTNSTLVSLAAKKWHWRARCSALTLFNLIPKVDSEDILFASSVLNLSEMLGIRPDLHKLKKIVYFHENQLIYPVQEIKKRDIQYAYNQITTCIAADLVLFNSEFNRTSFLENIKKVIKILPDYKPKNLKGIIQEKSKVIYFPVQFPSVIPTDSNKSTTCLHIVWPHRWEFDKGPEDLFRVLFKLKDNKYDFVVSILGESFTDNPSIFTEAKEYLKEEIKHFGFVENKEEYFEILQNAHVVVSTAKHEFFGVSMLEATYCGCYPLAPNFLVYPEIYPKECLYNNIEELYQRLGKFCEIPSKAMDFRKNLEFKFDRFEQSVVLEQFQHVFENKD